MRRVFVTSIPKSGTHLLMALVESLGFRRQQLDDAGYRQAWSEWTRLNRLFGENVDADEKTRLTTAVVAGRNKLIKFLEKAPSATLIGNHYVFDPELLHALRELDYVVVLMIRDPQGQTFSFRSHVLRDTANKLYPRFSTQSAEQTYLDLLHGAPAGPGGQQGVTSVVDLYEAYQGWLTSPSVHVIGFHHIIGAKGDGLRLRQLFEADRLLAKIGRSPQVDPDECVRTMYNAKHSLFVHGRAAKWTWEFSRNLQMQFEAKCAGRLQRYLDLLADENPPGWAEYAASPLNLRRAWWLAERDLADAMAELAEARLEVARMREMAEHIESDSQERLALIHKLRSQLQDLRAQQAQDAG